MNVKELRKKTDSQLLKELGVLREHIRDVRFKLVTKQLKNIRHARSLKRSVARILTIMNERRISQDVNEFKESVVLLKTEKKVR